MKARQYYLNPSLGDKYLYFRKGSKLMFIHHDTVLESSVTLNRFYRYLRSGYFVKKKTPTVFINGNRSVEREHLIDAICVKWNLTPDQLIASLAKMFNNPVST